jgi:hypothetical protein
MSPKTIDLIQALLQREKKNCFLPVYKPDYLEEINKAIKEIQKL